MLNKIFSKQIITISVIIIIAAIARLIPHWPNFTPIAAMALFGGAMYKRKYLAFVVPLIALFISDLIIGFHSSMLAVYFAFIITVMIGMQLQKNIKAVNILLASLISSISFFLITNFAAWLVSPFYAKSFMGLIQSYIAGLAFFNNGTYGISMFLNEVLGALFYNTALFGIYYLVRAYQNSISIKVQ